MVAVDESLDEARRSAQTYLRVAEAVLAGSHSPLSAREIVERGIERGLFGDHTLGRTPEKSMQARLSLDIKHTREASRFVRVARGRFILRRRLSSPGEQSAAYSDKISTLSEYIAEPRRLRLPSEAVLCAPESRFRNILTFQGIDGDFRAIVPRLLADSYYVNRSFAEDRNDGKQFITYVLVQCGHRLLSFRRSYLSRAAEFLRGAKCVGFGGHVSAADNDIFSSTDHGLETCARRELSEELVFAKGNTERSRTSYATVSLFRNTPLECLGVLNDDSSEVGRRHVAVVYRAWISDWPEAQALEKGESSLRTLAWIDLTRSKIDITEYEYWSQLCLRRYYPSSVVTEPVIRHLKFRATQRASVLVVAGRIGSGKSEVSQYLAQRLGAKVVSSGVALQHLMGAPSIQQIGREEFQRRAEQFIRTRSGPEQLAGALFELIKASESARVVVDGIRQPETFDALATKLAERPALLYVHTPPDVAYEMYRVRESTSSLDFTYRDFLRVFDAPVEADLTTLGRSAQTYIYNFMGIDALRRSLDKLVKELD